MKQMTCAQMGGPADCTAMISGNTPEEMVDNGMKHVNEAHPKMAEDMKAMSKETTDKWMGEFQVKWAATPDM
jgi:predicted small metal-binding protein